MDPSLLPERLTTRIRVDQESGCWLWTGATNAIGYGQVRWNTRRTSPHRLTYELLVGSIPEGLVLDHLCRNRPCCFPDHLEAVTPQENLRRGGLARRCKTCRKGHEMATLPSGGHYCPRCRYQNKRKRLREQLRDPEYREKYRRYYREYYQQHYAAGLKVAPRQESLF